MREKYTYLVFFWSTFSRIWSEYGDLFCKSPFSVQMLENADQRNFEYGHYAVNILVKRIRFKWSPVKCANFFRIAILNTTCKGLSLALTQQKKLSILRLKILNVNGRWHLSNRKWCHHRGSISSFTKCVKHVNGLQLFLPSLA